MNKTVEIKLNEYKKEYAAFHETLEEARAELKKIEEEIDKVKTNVKNEARTNNKLLSLIKGKSSKSLAELLAQKEIAELTIESLIEAEQSNKTEVTKKALEYIYAVEEEIEEIRIENRKQIERAEKLEEEAKQIRMKHGSNAYLRMNDTKKQEVARNLKDILDIKKISWNSSLSDIKNMLESR